MGLIRALLGQSDLKKYAEQSSAAQESYLNHRFNEIKADNDRQLKRLTRILSASAGIVAVTMITIIALSIYARIEGNHAIKESRANVESAIQEMNRKFELLAGGALHGPKLEMAIPDGNLDGAVIYANKENPELVIPAIFVTNIGDARTGQVKVKMLFSEKPLSINARNPEKSLSAWRTEASADPLFPSVFSFQYPEVETLGPQEMWLIGETVVRFPEQPASIFCKLVVDFGIEEPTKADFMLVSK